MSPRLALPALAIVLLGAAPPAPGRAIPPQFHGYWAREGGRCLEERLQMEGVLTIQADGMVHGEVVKDVRAVRRVSDRRIGVDTRDTGDGTDSWTATTLLTLAPRGHRLTFEPTRMNGNRLRNQRPEVYLRCP